MKPISASELASVTLLQAFTSLSLRWPVSPTLESDSQGSKLWTTLRRIARYYSVVKHTLCVDTL